MKSLKRSFKQKLDQASTLEDLLPFLRCIDLDTLRSFVKHTLGDVDNSQKSSIYCHSLSLTDILDVDTNQYILSFIRFDEISQVCRLFYQLSMTNEKQLIAKFIESNKYRDGESAYIKTIDYQFLQQSRLNNSKSIFSYEKSIKLLKCQQNKLSKQLSTLQDEIHSLTKEKSLLKSMTSAHLNSKNVKLPLFPEPYIKGFNNIWIVTDKRRYLTNEEKNLGYKGPFIHPMLAAKQAKSGDKILILPGIYTDCEDDCVEKCIDLDYEDSELPTAKDLYFIFEDNKSLYLIGINPQQTATHTKNTTHTAHTAHTNTKNAKNRIYGQQQESSSACTRSSNGAGGACGECSGHSRVVFQSNMADGEAELIFWLKNGNIYLENIVIDSETQIHAYEGTVDVSKYSKLWMKDCIIKTGQVGMVVEPNSSVFIKNCSFIGGYLSGNGIIIRETAKEVLIAHSVFMNFGNEHETHYKGEDSCISIEKYPNDPNITVMMDNMDGIYPSYGIYGAINTGVSGKIINNIFCNNYGYPIACNKTITQRNSYKFKEKFEIRRNKVNGYNGISVKRISKLDSIKNQKNVDANWLYYNCQNKKIDTLF